MDGFLYPLPSSEEADGQGGGDDASPLILSSFKSFKLHHGMPPSNSG